MKPFLFFAILTSSALADVYRPLDFALPTTTSQRDVLTDLRAYRQLETTSALAVVETVDGTQMPVFSEIAERVEALSQAEGQALYQLPSRSCPLTETLAQACPAAAPALEACLVARNPHRHFESDRAPAVNERTMSTLPGMIRLVAYGLRHLPIPKGLVSNEVEQMIPVVLGKIAYPKLLQGLERGRSALASCPDATRALSEIDATATELNQRQQAHRSPNLPYPSLTPRERELLSAHLFAVLWRARGGGVYKLDGTQKARKLYGQLPFQVLAELNGLKGADVGGGMYWALVMRGWGRFFDVGHTPGEEDRNHDLINLLDRGLYQVESAARTLRGEGHRPRDLEIAGLHMAACYDIGWSRLRDLHIVPQAPRPLNDLTKGGTSWGEVCWGYAMGLGLARSLR